jgi:hypothetical protein
MPSVIGGPGGCLGFIPAPYRRSGDGKGVNPLSDPTTGCEGEPSEADQHHRPGGGFRNGREIELRLSLCASHQI